LTRSPSCSGVPPAVSEPIFASASTTFGYASGEGRLAEARFCVKSWG
jgi:hypothetical protein